MATSALPNEWLVEALPKLYREQPDLVQPLLQNMLSESEELRWNVVLQAYLDERISLGKAAELLGLHELELREQFLRLGIPLRLGPATIDEARAEVEAARAWRNTLPK